MNKYILIILLFFIFPLNVLSKEVYLENIIIENYDIKFDKDIYEYSINIDEEKELNIDYILSDDEAYVSIIGNGNFNKTKNEIIINVNNQKEYKIYAYKSIKTSIINENIKEMNSSEKEVVKLSLISFLCSIVIYIGYFLFIKKESYDSFSI